MLSSNTYIISSALIRVGRYFNKSYKDLIRELVAELNKDLPIHDYIDYVVVSNVFSDSILEQLDISTMIIQELNLTPKPAVRVEAGESSGLMALKYAHSLIKSGMTSTVLVIGVEKLVEYPTTVVNKYMVRLLNSDVEGRYDIVTVNEAALLMKLYMKKHGHSREDLTIWPIKMHENAVNNPYAQLRNRITKEQVINSQIISDPLRLFDVHPLGDGASAIVLTNNKELMSKVGTGCVELIDVLHASAPPLTHRSDLLSLPASKYLFSKLGNYGVDLSDCVLEIHDSYTILAYLIVEELGLSDRGKAPYVVTDIKNINLSGGLKARGHPVGATGVYQVAEVHRLLTSGLGSIKLNNSWGLVHSMSSIDNNAAVALIRRCG